MRELGDDPDREKARALRAKLEETNRKAEHIGRKIREITPAHQGRRDAPQRDVPIRQHLQALRQQIAQLKEAGRHDEAERVTQHARQLVQRFKQQQKDQPAAPAEDLPRRLRHLKVAIDNLNAAGLHEAAQKLNQQLQQGLAQLRQRQAHDRPRDQNPEQAIRQLRGEVERLRHELNEARLLLQQKNR